METGSHSRRLRVLLSAFAFAPGRGSEAGVGWEVATRLTRYCDVTVLCGDLAASQPTKAILDQYFATNPALPGLTIHYIPPTRFITVLEGLHSKPCLWPLYYSAYKAWHREALAAASQLNAQAPFDIVHQLTYTTYREPGYLWTLPVPFFWGPVAGAVDVPLRFARVLGVQGTIKFGVRHLANILQARLSHRARDAARAAQLVWVCTRAEGVLVEKWGGLYELQREVGTTVARQKLHNRSPRDPLQVIWSGLHEPGKALWLALHAVAGLRGRATVKLHILGAGSDTERCRKLAERLNVASSLVWHGRVSHERALALMSEADVLLHSSLKEATSTVIPEALSFGLPVVCHDACGMAVAVTDDCGIRVPLRDPDTSITGFARALERLAKDTQLYKRMSEGALTRARELSWERKVQRINEAYVAVARRSTLDVYQTPPGDLKESPATL